MEAKKNTPEAEAPEQQPTEQPVAEAPAEEAPAEEAAAEEPAAEAAPAEQPTETTEPAAADAPAAETATEAPAAEAATEPAADEAPETVPAQAEAKEAPPAELPKAQGNGQHRAQIEDLLKAGCHFGHLTRRWNPKMKKYIFMERNGIYIIDLMQTQVLLDEAADAAARFTKMGRKILFVGTKKQARQTIEENAQRAGSPYVVERWFGGTLTNFQTIRQSIRRMENLARMQEDGTLDQLKKKERLMKAREHEKLERVLGGIADMGRLPGALFIVDINREHIAVNEARKLGIPIIAMVDTNTDPNLVDFPIPANDDALKSIQLVTSIIADAVAEGGRAREITQATREAEQQKRTEEAEA